MKTFKYLIGAAFVLSMVGSTSALAQTVDGTPHDLEVGTEGVCVYCHTPHNAGAGGAPLWNRDMAVTTFAMYSSPTLDMTIATDPVGVSLACLSCHDGATAYNNTIAPPPGILSAGGTMAAPFAIGLDGLGNDHPISLTYNTGDDPAFFAITGPAVKGANIGGLPLYGAGYDQVECATCHNPHDNTTNGKFLRETVASSTICTTCHQK